MSTKRDSKIGTMFSSFGWMGSAAWIKLMPFLMFSLLLNLDIPDASANGFLCANHGYPNRTVVLQASPLAPQI